MLARVAYLHHEEGPSRRRRLEGTISLLKQEELTDRTRQRRKRCAFSCKLRTAACEARRVLFRAFRV